MKGPLLKHLTVAAFVLTPFVNRADAGTITVSTLTDNESDVVNLETSVVSAANLGSTANGNNSVDINGIVHPVASAANQGPADELIPELSVNATFDGTYRGGNATTAGYTGDLQDLMSGIAGTGAPGPITLTITGLEVGVEYLFQGYWEANNFGQTASVTFEGVDTQDGIMGVDGLGSLISYSFTATDTTLEAELTKTDGADNIWWMGYCLQTTTVPPTLEIVSLDPADDATDVPTINNLVAAFNQVIQAGSGDITIKNLTQGSSEAIPVTDGNQVEILNQSLTINPTNALDAGDEYVIQIAPTAVEDTSGTSFAGIVDDETWTFTTDGTAPMGIGMAPMAGVTNVLPSAVLSLSFDEDVLAGAGTITVHLAGDDSVVQTIDVTSGNVVIDGSELTISLPEELELSTAYYVQVEAGAFQDPSGNAHAGIDDTTTWAFTTADSNPYTITILSEETDIVNTGGALVSAANFGAGEELVINGLVHGPGSASGANLTTNIGFQGDFRNNASGLPDGTVLNEMLEGIGGSSFLEMAIGNLTPGQAYLFQAYWEANNWGPGTQTLSVTIEGDSLTRLASQAPALLISYQFTAGDDTLEILMDRDDGLTGDGNNWLSGYSLQEVPSLTTIALSITPHAASVGHYDFRWESRDGKVYDLLSSTDLARPLAAWPVWMGNEEIAGTAPENELVDIPGGGDPARFFAVLEKDPPPLFAEDFESVVGPAPPTGWSVADNGAGSAWQVGAPSGVNTEPDAAANGTQCAGVNIGGDYTPSADASLITGAFTVPASGAVLNFSQYIDTEAPPSGDVGSIRLLNAGDNSVLAGGDVALDLDGFTEEWSEESIPLPAVANGLEVKLEFRFVSDDDAEAFAGFYIDDVEIVETAP